MSNPHYPLAYMACIAEAVAIALHDDALVTEFDRLCGTHLLRNPEPCEADLAKFATFVLDAAERFPDVDVDLSELN